MTGLALRWCPETRWYELAASTQTRLFQREVIARTWDMGMACVLTSEALVSLASREPGTWWTEADL